MDWQRRSPGSRNKPCSEITGTGTSPTRCPVLPPVLRSSFAKENRWPGRLGFLKRPVSARLLFLYPALVTHRIFQIIFIRLLLYVFLRTAQLFQAGHALPLPSGFGVVFLASLLSALKGSLHHSKA
jgi:hypothetical protein